MSHGPSWTRVLRSAVEYEKSPLTRIVHKIAINWIRAGGLTKCEMKGCRNRKAQAFFMNTLCLHNSKTVYKIQNTKHQHKTQHFYKTRLQNTLRLHNAKTVYKTRNTNTKPNTSTKHVYKIHYVYIMQKPSTKTPNTTLLQNTPTKHTTSTQCKNRLQNTKHQTQTLLQNTLRQHTNAKTFHRLQVDVEGRPIRKEDGLPARRDDSLHWMNCFSALNECELLLSMVFCCSICERINFC